MLKNITIGLFLTIVSLPFMVVVFKSDDQKPTFKLVHTKAGPTIKSKLAGFYVDIMSYKAGFTEYFEPVAMHDAVLDAYIYLKQNIFHEEPIPRKVVTGTDGWYFLGDTFSQLNLETTGLTLLTEGQLNRTKSTLLADQEWLASLGATGIVAMVPDKQSVYGQHLPFKKGPMSQLDQVSDACRSAEINFFVNLNDNIGKHTDRKLYAKADSHWSDLGAYYGAEGIIQAVQRFYPDVKMTELENYKDSLVVESNLDMARMLSMSIDDENIYLINKHPKAVRLPNKLVPTILIENGKNYERRFKSPVNDLKVLVFTDSFGVKLVQFLAECFGESVFIYNNSVYDEEIIRSEKPDIVILERAERYTEDLAHE